MAVFVFSNQKRITFSGSEFLGQFHLATFFIKFGGVLDFDVGKAPVCAVIFLGVEGY